MQVTRFGRDLSIDDRTAALTTAISGGILALIGLAVLIVGIAKADGSGTASTVESILFGIGATALGAFLLRFGARARRRLDSAKTAEPAADKS